ATVWLFFTSLEWILKLRSRTCSRSEASRLFSCSSVSLLSSTIFMLGVLLSNEPGLHRQLMGGQSHSFLGLLSGHAVHFEHHATLLHHSHKVVYSTFTATHRGFVAVCSHRLVREN